MHWPIPITAFENGKQNDSTSNSGLCCHNDPDFSGDGSRVGFVETDATHVRQRPVLVPDDPSYPRVQNHRFARVGEALEKRRVGVVDSNGTAILVDQKGKVVTLRARGAELDKQLESLLGSE